MRINRHRYNIPFGVIVGTVPPAASPIPISMAPPIARLHPVPAKILIRLLKPRVISPAKAEHSVLSRIIPSPDIVNEFPLLPPIFRRIIPDMPIAHPITLFPVRWSLLKNMHAKMTNIKVPVELRMAAREPSL